MPNNVRRPRAIGQPFRIIGANRRLYLLLNLATYGIGLIGFAVGLIFPELVQARAASMEEDGTADLVLSIFSQPWLFALVILGVNVFQLSALTIVLPSLIVPFAGVAAFGVWVAVTGVSLAPTSETGWVALIPHSLTVIIEFQAYILLALGAFLLGKYWLFPRTVGAKNRRQGYVRGLQTIGWLALPAFALLIIGAIWEAFSLVYMVGPLSQLLL
ncbi:MULTISPECIES: stage II sporulation protein M [unclassified Microbacterium]|uniref:stage II sporulation protein M n=1 Tax=unclassified Microbacterium TaxID=2609290 RepID=UPI000EA9A0E3|nr:MULTISPECIES: stage II sporulation protein M [unclassified Microbacterium]MBT2486433.1 hypothetical protein [Microbacterium sp. ISL-108]RKN69133.1 stage II sporulation protein M [Microbacterium sp. CGR2]